MTVAAQEIARALRIFASERFPLGVSLPLAFGLCVGPYAIAGGDWPVFLRAVAATFLVLFVLRIVDDVLSIDEDTIKSPERALPAGRISVPALAKGAAVLFAAALLVSLSWLSLALVLQALYYASYFYFAKRIPVVVKPVLVNVVFLSIPTYVGLTGGELHQHCLLMLGLFFWLSVIGHDYAHNVHADGESHFEVETCSQILGPRKTATVGLVCYVGAFVVGVLSVCGPHGFHERPSLFLIGLTVLFAQIIFLLVRLIIEPSRARARPLYVGGFSFFVIPSVLLGLDRLLNM